MTREQIEERWEYIKDHTAEIKHLIVKRVKARNSLEMGEWENGGKDLVYLYLSLQNLTLWKLSDLTKNLLSIRWLLNRRWNYSNSQNHFRKKKYNH